MNYIYLLLYFACLIKGPLDMGMNLVKVITVFEKSSGLYLENVMNLDLFFPLLTLGAVNTLCLMIHFTSGPLALALCIVYFSLPTSLLSSLTFLVLSHLFFYKFINLFVNV